jgi:putative transposase
MQMMNLKAIYPGPNTSKRNLQELVYPYLLKDLQINRANQVWQTDITYLRRSNGFIYLTALIDVYSRLVVGYRLSSSLCVDSCLLALEDAISKYGEPEIINSDQGSQFTSTDWVSRLSAGKISISMTGKGRCNDNANIERLWRSFKYEGSYLYKWYSVLELKGNIRGWLDWYNNNRPHQALDYKTPYEVYCGFMDKPYALPTIPQYQQLQESIFCS